MNYLSEKENNDNENLTNCKYRDISYFSNLDVEFKSKCLLFFHLNINSLSKNFDNFNHLIMSLNKPQLNQLQDRLCCILSRDILTKLVLTLLFISQKISNLFLLKLLYCRKVTSLLDVFINIHAWIYSYLMTIILIPC